MIYTVGLASIYGPYLLSSRYPMKGKGGSVWKSKREATGYLTRNGGLDKYRVYRVLERWSRTSRVAGVEWRSLRRPAKLEEAR